MVSAQQVIEHYTGVAEEIEEMLSEFGKSRKVPGFWCIFDRKSRSLMGCMYCPSENYCPMSRGKPILKRRYKPESNWHLNDIDDITLHWMNRRGLKHSDWVWLAHPETRNPPETRDYIELKASRLSDGGRTK